MAACSGSLKLKPQVKFLYALGVIVKKGRGRLGVAEEVDDIKQLQRPDDWEDYESPWQGF